jgi:antitoxin (DNA-binding transcriptional repressor) of toxin-antitoxin stability system
MTTILVNTHEAKSRLSELIRRAEGGDEVIVARSGRPVAKIIAWPPGTPDRTPGAWAGRVSGDLDDIGSDDDVLEAFDSSAASLS